MNQVTIVILAVLLTGLLIALAPLAAAVLVLYGLVEFIKYYFPSKHAKKRLKKEEKKEQAVNTFKIDFLRGM